MSSFKLSKLGVVVPCFNEASRLDFTYFLEISMLLDCILIFVDDGSTDETPQLIRESFNVTQRPFVLVSLEKNLGKAGAISNGLSEALRQELDFVVFCDADKSIHPNDIKLVFEKIQSNTSVNLVSGARVPLSGSNVIRNDFRKWMGRLIATVVGHLTHLAIYDPMSPLKIYRLKIFKGENRFIPRTKWLGEIELMFYSYNLDRSNFVIEEVSIDHWRDEKGGHIGLRSFFILLKDFMLLRQSIHHFGEKPADLHRRKRINERIGD